MVLTKLGTFALSLLFYLFLDRLEELLILDLASLLADCLKVNLQVVLKSPFPSQQEEPDQEAGCDSPESCQEPKCKSRPLTDWSNNGYD